MYLSWVPEYNYVFILGTHLGTQVNLGTYLVIIIYVT